MHHYQQHILGRKDALTTEESELLDSLDKRLQDKLDSFPRDGDSEPEFFVRLSSRSPKDVGLGPEHPKVLEVHVSQNDKRLVFPQHK